MGHEQEHPAGIPSGAQSNRQASHDDTDIVPPDRDRFADSAGVMLLDLEVAELLGGERPHAMRLAGRPARSTQSALDGTEALACNMVDTYGPTWARQLAVELEDAARSIERPGSWGGGR